MLDRKFILENETLVAENCRNRGVEVDVQKLVALEQQRRQLQADAEEANRLANASRSAGKAISGFSDRTSRRFSAKCLFLLRTLHCLCRFLQRIS